MHIPSIEYLNKNPNNLLQTSKMHGTSKEKGKQKHQRATTSTHSICMSLLTSNLTKHSINVNEIPQGR